MIKWDPALRANREFQSALVRMGFWVFGVIYVGSAAYTGYYQIDWVYFFPLFGVYFLFFTGVLISVLIRPEWTARQYLGLVLDITAVSLAIFLTGDVSPFYLVYIWILIYASTRYGRGHLIFASVLNLLTCTLTIVVLDAWRTHPYEVVFVLLLLVVLPMYQHSLLRKLQQARYEAEVANQAKGNFLAIMTHELRTPLTGVVGMTNLLQSTPLDAEQREYVDSIVSSAEVLQALIGDVLDLSKIEAKQLHLESVAFDLRGSMKEVCAALETQALAKGLEVILRIDPKLPDRMIGDKLRVRQILFNLIGNAVKFTDRGEVRVHASWCPFDELMHRPHLLLEVLDTGPGRPVGGDLRGLSAGGRLHYAALWRDRLGYHHRPQPYAPDGGAYRRRQPGRKGQSLLGTAAPPAGTKTAGLTGTATTARWAAGLGVRAQCHEQGTRHGDPTRCGYDL